MVSYRLWVQAHPLLSAACQFALLGTLGEVVAASLRSRRLALPCSLLELMAKVLAWALLGLAAAGTRDLPGAQRGMESLLASQRPDGTWHEALATGTGFPGVFYLTYHMYRNYFPLLALATYGR